VTSLGRETREGEGGGREGRAARGEAKFGLREEWHGESSHGDRELNVLLIEQRVGHGAIYNLYHARASVLSLSLSFSLSVSRVEVSSLRIFSLFRASLRPRASSLPVLTIGRRPHSLPCAPAGVPYKSCRTPAGTNVRLFAGITWPRHEG